MAGARFVRADLHVHLSPEGADEMTQAADDYVAAALNKQIEVLGITDHNSVANVRPALTAAEGKPILILPGIEVGSSDGHLLAFFPPDDLDQLEAFATAQNLALGARLADGSRRSTRTMRNLLDEIQTRGGFGIAAHVDANDGIQAMVARGELAELLSHPALAGLEFRRLENLQRWFGAEDHDDDRQNAGAARLREPELAERGIALVMSSDAHDSSLVGKDGTDQPLTRLRVGEPSYTAVRNALLYNPKARCKVEADLPASFPRVLSASFQGGFLDGVSIEFADNLNCLIGGRGSGKSTALLAIRAALGAQQGPDEDDFNDAERMPQRTVVRFVDPAGTERVAVRELGDIARDEDSLPIELPLADLSQGESAYVASNYRTDRQQMLAFLDSFCRLEQELDAERDVLERLNDNAAEVKRTAFREQDYKQAALDRQKLEASIKSARAGKLEEVATWALRLATQQALIEQIRQQLERAGAAPTTPLMAALGALAKETGTDLEQRPIADFAQPLDATLVQLNEALKQAGSAHVSSVKAATTALTKLLEDWDEEFARWQTRRRQRTEELEQQGFKVQAGALTTMGERLQALTKQLADLSEKRRQHKAALAERDQLLEQLRERRRLIFERRRATLRLVAQRANDSTLGLRINVSYSHEAMRKVWRDWLSPRFRHRGQRLIRLSRSIKPWQFAELVKSGNRGATQALTDDQGDGQPFFTSDDIEQISELAWEEVFELETMRLEDVPRIDVSDSDHREAREFNHLSAGQQRSVLLSLLLCADRADPLIVDQPEDQLDAPYIATGVVRHLERPKERRQLIIDTHNANLTVLGDAELVVPLYAEGGVGTVRDAGAVDDSVTLSHVCRLLEGGASAYARRGQRYGFEFSRVPPDL